MKVEESAAAAPPAARRTAPRRVAAATAAVAIAAATVAPAAASGLWEPAGATSGEPSELDVLVERGRQLADFAHQFEYMGAQARRDRDLRSARRYRAQMHQVGEQAIDVLERALALAPDNPDLHFALADAYYSFVCDYYDNDVPMPARRDAAARKAIAHWDRFEQIAPDDPRRYNALRGWSHPHSLAGPPALVDFPYQFERSIALTKLGGDDNYRRALADYEFLLDWAEAAPEPLTLFTAQNVTNAAELLMALGRLDEAIDYYRLGLDLADDPLYYYGLAVALDRDGQWESALEVMRDGAARDAAPLAALGKDSVFFIPRGDVHYYYGLGYEALGDRDKALTHFREFVATSPGRYRDQAQRHIDALTAKRGRARRRAR